MPSTEDQNSTRFVPWSEVENLTSLSRTTVWRKIRDGEFPKPIKLSTHRVAWIESEILDWKRQMIEASREI